MRLKTPKKIHAAENIVQLVLQALSPLPLIVAKGEKKQPTHYYYYPSINSPSFTILPWCVAPRHSSPSARPAFLCSEAEACEACGPAGSQESSSAPGESTWTVARNGVGGLVDKCITNSSILPVRLRRWKENWIHSPVCSKLLTERAPSVIFVHAAFAELGLIHSHSRLCQELVMHYSGQAWLGKKGIGIYLEIEPLIAKCHFGGVRLKQRSQRWTHQTLPSRHAWPAADGQPRRKSIRIHLSASRLCPWPPDTPPGPS